MKQSSSLLHRATLLVQLALLAFSLLMILIPTMRVGVAHVVFMALLFTSCSIDFHAMWKAGYLTKTPGQIYEHTRRSPGRLPTTALGRLSFAVAVIAMVMVMRS
jgi:hypothetical protein